MTHGTPEQEQATLHRAFALAANVYAMRLQLTRSALDREASPVAYQLAQLHYAAYRALVGDVGRA